MANNSSNAPDSRPVFFFDIDNCISLLPSENLAKLTVPRDKKKLYSRSKKVQELMQDLIEKYCITHLRLAPDEATGLNKRYYTDYGLAIAGLVQHHSIEPMEFNTLVDDALPLDGVITPDPALKKLLEDMDKSKIRLWAFTNAYVTHANRVLRLLGVEALFEGVTYCDYGQWPLVCKPMGEMFEKAEREAGSGGGECFFVDDSYLNCHHAHLRPKWTTIHLLEPTDPFPPKPAAKYQIRSLQELRALFPQFFIGSRLID